jgi:hypothetical protein
LDPQGGLTVTYSEPGRAWQHVLATDSNVVIGVHDIVKHVTVKIH